MSFNFSWAGQEPARNTSNHEASIDDILPTTASRVDLILLVALCTDKMRDGLTAAFEPHKVPASKPDLNDLLLFEDDETEAQRRDVEHIRNMELNSAQMQGLKRASVTFFNAWRTAVLRRMGEALNVRSEAVKQAKVRYTSAQEAEARAKKDNDFYAWAEGRDDDVMPMKVDDTSFMYERITTPLEKMGDKKKALILNSCLFMLLSLENYSAHSRVLMLYLCHCLALPVDVLSSSEATLAATLIKSASSSEMNADPARRQRAAQDAAARKWKVGLATIGGAALLAVTGGLAAPLLLGAAGTIMGGIGLGGLASLLGATIANPVTVAALFGTLGGRMSGSAMDKYAKEVRDFKLIPVRKPNPESAASSPEQSPSPTSHKLRVIIGVSGWLLDETDITRPWKTLSGDSFEPFALQYERKALIELGTTLDNVLRTSAYTLAQAGAMQLVLPAIAAAMLPVSLLKAGQFLDNPFSIALKRSDKAGKVLAAALIAKAQGERPVTLVGFSLGARVIYACLRELAAQNVFGLVENVVVAGSPVPSDEMVWRRMRSIVLGRLVNVYTKNDILLGFLYRTRNAQLNIAGLQAVKVKGVENKDVSDFVHGHQQYRLAMGTILKEIQFHDIDENEIEKEGAELKYEDAMEKKTYQEARASGRLRDQEDEDGKIVMVDATQMEVDGNAPFPHPDSRRSSIEKKEPLSHDVAPLFHKQPAKVIELKSESEEEDDEEDEDNDGQPHMITLDPGPEPESDNETDLFGRR